MVAMGGVHAVHLDEAADGLLPDGGVVQQRQVVPPQHLHQLPSANMWDSVFLGLF
jgi:hypothetical protein